MTRFSTTEELEGCRNWTYWPLPMLNCCQLMMALWEAWFITMPFAFGVLWWPAPTTCPPVGFANAIRGERAPNPAAAVAMRRPSCASSQMSFKREFSGLAVKFRYDMALSSGPRAWRHMLGVKWQSGPNEIPVGRTIVAVSL